MAKAEPHCPGHKVGSDCVRAAQRADLQPKQKRRLLRDLGVPLQRAAVAVPSPPASQQFRM